MEYIPYIVVASIVFSLGTLYGWHLRERHATRTLERFLQEAKAEEVEQPDDLTHIVIEKHNDVFYVYDKENNTFMAQGSSKEELEDNLKKRYPDKRFACPEKILKEVGFMS